MTNASFGQTNASAQAPQQPATKIEAFSSKTGIVMIKGFSTIGIVRGRGSVTIDAREFRDASNPSQGVYGIAIEVKEAGRLEREDRSFIDFDEIDSLVRGLDYIAKITKSVTQLNDFEAQYRTKGDFSVTVFSDSSGGLSLSVGSGRIGKTSAFLNMSDLGTLKSHILEAKRVIEMVRVANK
jgi:hypothetical protein